MIPRTLDARVTAHMLVAAVLIVLGTDIFRVGFVYVDNFRALELASRLEWFEFTDESAGLAERYRPLNFLLTKAVLQIHGADFYVFRSAQLATLVVLLLGWTKACDPRTWPDFWRFAVATACLLGLHTTRFLVHGTPLNTYTIVSALGLWTIVLARGATSHISWLWPAVLTLLALLTMEMGIIVPAIVVTGYFVGWRGATAGGAAGATMVLAGYVILRATASFGFGESAFYAETGYGFDVLDLPQQERLFGSWPIVFYAYNVGSTLLTVLASEPRNGVFEFLRSVLTTVGLAPWQCINVVTSAGTTAIIIWALIRGPVCMPTIWVSSAALLTNAALGFLYVRDRIPSFAGLMYALCLYVCLGPVFDRLRSDRPRRVRWLAAITLCSLATGWGLRTVGAHVALRDAAWGSRQEWVTRTMQWSELSSPEDVAAAKLFVELKRQALSRDVPDPRHDAPWTHRWFERDSSVR